MKTLFDTFVQRINEKQLKMEGIYVAKDNMPVFEHRWTEDRPRQIYSNTKSFVSTAIGIAMEEGLISLDERLADVFPDKVPAQGNPGIEEITLKHLMTMSSGFGKPLLMMFDRKNGEGFPDYLAYMMSQPVICKPGTKFCYSSGDSILAGRMLEEKIGKNLMEYMYEKVFKPLDIGLPVWECCPKGHPLGGSGLFLSLNDMAKLGQLYLDGGKWQGRQIVPESWVHEATKMQIDNPVPEEVKASGAPESPWHGIGYGYMFWLCPYPGSFRADGSFGQITLVLPEKNMVVAVQCPEAAPENFFKIQDILHDTILQL